MEALGTLTAREQNQVRMDVDTFNKSIAQGKVQKQEMGKDEFIKILITQLSHQDPTAPMEDKEFIAQMAQFSSLEQMTNMAQDFSKLASVFSNSEAVSSLGKQVEIPNGEELVSGTVKAVTRGINPEVLVNGSYYAWEQVSKVFEE